MGVGYVYRVLVIDKLGSHAPARRRALRSVERRQPAYLNNTLPPRRRRPSAYAYRPAYRHEMIDRSTTWNQIIEATRHQPAKRPYGRSAQPPTRIRAHRQPEVEQADDSLVKLC